MEGQPQEGVLAKPTEAGGETKKEAQITYALMLQLVDGLAAIIAMDD